MSPSYAKGAQAAVKGDGGDGPCEDEIHDVRDGKHARGLPIRIEDVVELHYGLDIGQKDGQYDQQNVERTLEQRDDRCASRQREHADSTEDAEAVVKILVKRHRVKDGHANVDPDQVIERNEQRGDIIIQARNRMSAVNHHV